MKIDNFIWAIVNVDGDYTIDEKKELIELVNKNDDIKLDADRVKVGHLFKIIDNIRFWQFDSDVVLFDDNSYYHTGNSQVQEQIENKDIVAIIDENGEIEFIN